ncbi:MAG: hypothetical protein II195_01375 [Selenomonadales bacterium]|nr:hypothetical protein [Selenomonadales bacterium]
MNKIMLPLGGTERQIKFTINAIQEMEAQIFDKNVLTMMSREVWSITDIITVCYCGLRACDKTVTRKEVQEWVVEYAAQQDSGIMHLQMILSGAIGISGLIGTKQKSVFEGILANVTNTDSGK